MALLRYQLFLAYAAAFLSAWCYALKALDSNSQLLSSPVARVLIRFAPFWAVVGLGLYALTLLVIGVAQFKDRPDAAADLDRDVKAAKQELAKRGIK